MSDERQVESRTFVVHVVSLVAATLSILASIGTGTAAFFPVAGAFLVASGVAAWRGRRSLLQPRGLRGRMDRMADATERQQLEQASGLMMGVLLMFFGVVALGFGLYITLW